MDGLVGRCGEDLGERWRRLRDWVEGENKEKGDLGGSRGWRREWTGGGRGVRRMGQLSILGLVKLYLLGIRLGVIWALRFKSDGQVK